MPTINTIGSNPYGVTSTGRDYETLQLYANFLAGTAFPTGIYQGSLFKDSEFAVAGTVGQFTSVGSGNPDASNYLVLQPASGQSFSDNPSVRTNALFYNAANGVGINNTATGGTTNALWLDDFPFTQIIGLQIKCSDGKNLRFGEAGTNNMASSLVSNCILDGTNSSNRAFVFSNAGAGPTLNNCLFLGASGNECVLINAATGTTTFNFCTFIAKAGQPYMWNNSACTYNNCAFFGAGGGTAFNSQTPLADTFSHCVTDITGTTGLTGGKTFANQFVSTTNDFRAKSGADLINAGAPIGGITTDISGFTRNASTPTVGAWEVASTAGRSGILLLGGSLGWVPTLRPLLLGAAAWGAEKVLRRNATLDRRKFLRIGR